MAKAEYDELVRACDVGLIFLDKRFTIPNFPSRLLSYLESKMPVIAATDVNTDVGTIIEDAKCGDWCESGDLVKFNSILSEVIDDKKILPLMSKNAFDLLMKRYQVEATYFPIMEKLKIKQ